MGFEGRKFQVLIAVALILGVTAPLAIYMLPLGREAVENVEEPFYAREAGEAEVIDVIETVTTDGGVATTLTAGLEGYKELLEALETQSMLLEELNRPVGNIIPIVPLTATATAVPEAMPVKAAQAGVIGTNVQVAGVDESDVAEILGPLVASISDGDVVLYSLEDLSVKSVIKAPEGFKAWGLMSRGEDILVVIFESVEGLESTVKMKVKLGDRELVIPVRKAPATLVKVYNVIDPTNPVEERSFEVSGRPAAARMEGDTLIVITEGASIPGGKKVEIAVPSVGGRPVPPSRIILGVPGPVTPLNILVANAITGDTDSYTLYTFPNPTVYYNSGYLVVATSGVTGEPIVVELLKAYAEALEKRDPEAAASILELLEEGRIFKAVKVAIDSFKRLDEEAKKEILNILSKKLADLSKEGIGDVTILHVFRVEGPRIEYKGSTRLPGSVLDQFAVELKDGYLVVATTLHKVRGIMPLPSPEVRVPPEVKERDYKVTIELPSGEVVELTLTIPPSPEDRGEWLERFFNNMLAAPLMFALYNFRGAPLYTNVYIVSPEDLEVKAVVEGIGEGMRLYAARLRGDILFIVSYRLVDPLYAIDLSDPLNPKLIGKLKVPGFSEYLHPVGEGLLLGVGVSEERWASKVSLYKVIDPLNMEELASVKVGGLWPLALTDYHAFTYDPENRRAFLPAAVNRFMQHGNAVIVVKVLEGEPWLDVEKVVEVDGVLRVFAWNGYIAVVAIDKLVVLDRASLEEVKVIEASG